MAQAGVYQSPIGPVLIESVEGCITRLEFLDGPADVKQKEAGAEVAACIVQLEQYFAGARKEFDLRVNNIGTGFRRRTWQELQKIPYGKTITYKELAIAVGNPNAVRAVGGANHHNNIAIIVPCHRVIGSNGKLVGYGGALWRKEWLLNHERKFA